MDPLFNILSDTSLPATVRGMFSRLLPAEQYLAERLIISGVENSMTCERYDETEGVASRHFSYQDAMTRVVPHVADILAKTFTRIGDASAWTPIVQYIADARHTMANTYEHVLGSITPMNTGLALCAPLVASVITGSVVDADTVRETRGIDAAWKSVLDSHMNGTYNESDGVPMDFVAPLIMASDEFDERISVVRTLVDTVCRVSSVEGDPSAVAFNYLPSDFAGNEFSVYEACVFDAAPGYRYRGGDHGASVGSAAAQILDKAAAARTLRLRTIGYAASTVDPARNVRIDATSKWLVSVPCAKLLHAAIGAFPAVMRGIERNNASGASTSLDGYTNLVAGYNYQRMFREYAMHEHERMVNETVKNISIGDDMRELDVMHENEQTLAKHGFGKTELDLYTAGKLASAEIPAVGTNFVRWFNTITDPNFASLSPAAQYSPANFMSIAFASVNAEHGQHNAVTANLINATVAKGIVDNMQITPDIVSSIETGLLLNPNTSSVVTPDSTALFHHMYENVPLVRPLLSGYKSAAAEITTHQAVVMTLAALSTNPVASVAASPLLQFGHHVSVSEINTAMKGVAYVMKTAQQVDNGSARALLVLG